ncbi:hypothetical protein K445DRAFT_23812 [Daldinia sp. EC12]|nr:hypothetical protein F4774DRAFT_427888 [Daldinia eschscholtzii]OTB14411.1 hypothetical protein K445DRAFT_23812 [Daldinia sp. EC12]
MASTTTTESSMSTPSEHASTIGWSVPDSDIPNLLNLHANMEPFGGSEFDFPSAFPAHTSLSHDNHSPSGLHQVPSSDNFSHLLSLHSSGPLDSAPVLLTSSPTQTLPAQCLSNNSHNSEPLSTPAASSTSSPGPRCGCLCALLHAFEDTGAQITSSPDVETDTLFQCLQQGTQECQAMLSCQECDTSIKNPILLATLGSQLVAIARELVTRFIQCQNRDIAPVVFQFGRYSVQGTGMQTRLLRDMVALHIRDLYSLLDRCRLTIDSVPGSSLILENAKLEANKLHEMLSRSLESVCSLYS